MLENEEEGGIETPLEDRGSLTITQLSGQAGEARFWSAFYVILTSLGLFWRKRSEGESFKDLKLWDGIVSSILDRYLVVGGRTTVKRWY